MNLAGSVLAVAGVVFVVLRVYKYSGEIDPTRFDAFEWTVFAGFAFVYGFLNLMLAFAWRNLLEYFGSKVTGGWAVKTYGVSQIAKYVPGNITHLASRQALGMSSGIPGWHLFKSIAWELGLISGTGAMFAILIVPLFYKAFSPLISVAVFFSLPVLFGICLYYIRPDLARAFFWYFVFLLFTGFLFAGIIYLILDESIPWLFICGACVVAWLAGLLTPGAPAGVGVREVVLYLLLKGLITEADLIFAVLLGRIMTVGGDMLFFVFALTARKINVLTFFVPK